MSHRVRFGFPISLEWDNHARALYLFSHHLLILLLVLLVAHLSETRGDTVVQSVLARRLRMRLCARLLLRSLRLVLTP